MNGLDDTERDGPSVAEMAYDGDPLDALSSWELQNGLQAAMRHHYIAEHEHRRQDARLYAAGAEILRTELRLRTKDGSGRRQVGGAS